jgi:hypothetical protein
MKILNRDELDEQRKNYVRYIDVLKRLDVRVQDGSLTDKEVRDATFTLHSRLLAFILSELLHMSQILREMENQAEVEFLTEVEDQNEDEFDDLSKAQIEEEASGYGPIPEEPPAEHITEEGGDEPIHHKSDETLGGTAKLLSALAELESAGTTDENQRIVDDIYKLAEKLEDEEE